MVFLNLGHVFQQITGCNVIHWSVQPSRLCTLAWFCQSTSGWGWYNRNDSDGDRIVFFFCFFFVFYGSCHLEVIEKKCWLYMWTFEIGLIWILKHYVMSVRDVFFVHSVSLFLYSTVASLFLVSLPSHSLKMFRLLFECAHISACPRNINKGALICEGLWKVHTNMSVRVAWSQACRKQSNEQLNPTSRHTCNELTRADEHKWFISE